MKIKRMLIWAGLLVLVAVVIFFVRYPYMLRGLKHVYLKGHITSYISDFADYPRNKVPNGTVQAWPGHRLYNRFKLPKRLERYNKTYGTVAYLVIKNDSILIEKYYKGYTADSLSNSFSMAKSITMLLLAKAIRDGHIRSLDQKLKDFIPDIQGPYADSVKLRHLAMMSGGTDWDENYYSPLSITAESYFSDNLDDLMIRRVHFVNPPGKHWFYSSGDTQFLGMAIRRATGKSLADYLSESFWQPMGMRREAWWNTDRPGGMEKTFCCIASNARDFARFGKLMMHKGNWNGQQLVDTALVEEMIRPQLPDMPRYGLQWWLFDHKGIQGFTMRGHLGQYVMVIPSENTIIVRLGERKPVSKPGTYAGDFFVYLEEGLRLARQAGSR